MIHKEDDKWVGDFNAQIDKINPFKGKDLQSELKKLEGEEIFTRADVRTLMLIARKEPSERVATLEKENAGLKAELHLAQQSVLHFAKERDELQSEIERLKGTVSSEGQTNSGGNDSKSTSS